jgi:hypothetical protein
MKNRQPETKKPLNLVGQRLFLATGGESGTQKIHTLIYESR